MKNTITHSYFFFPDFYHKLGLDGQNLTLAHIIGLRYSAFMKPMLVIALALLSLSPALAGEGHSAFRYQSSIGLKCSEFIELWEHRDNSANHLASYYRSVLWLHGYYAGRNQRIRTQPEKAFQLSAIAQNVRDFCKQSENDAYTYKAYEFIYKPPQAKTGG